LAAYRGKGIGAMNAVVFLPGIMGSELRLGNESVWPGPFSSLLLPYQKMSQLMRSDLVATDIIRSFSFSEQYKGILDDLKTCGFEDLSDPRTLYVVPFDWRKSNVLSAIVLADTLDKAVMEHNGDVTLSVIAHSMGGLVARYYLESGEFSKREGIKRVRHLITLGTPHRGAPLALTAAMGMERRLFLSKDQVLQLASDPRYPSLYELLPPPDEPFAWDDSGQSAFAPLNIYDSAISEGLGLISANLDSAANFQGKLSIARRPEGVRYFFFAGTRQVTSSCIYITKTDPRFRARSLDLPDAGDGTVPIWSSHVTGIQSRLVGGEHGTIYKNRELRTTLSVLLGKRGVLAAEERIELSVRDKVVEPGAPVNIVISFPDIVQSIDGSLRFERVDSETGNERPIGSDQVIAYAGPPLDSISLLASTPNYSGLYRVRFSRRDKAGYAASDDMFVQEIGS
jgi:pimeloyl-ACP methyl ester carboxylesterase